MSYAMARGRPALGRICDGYLLQHSNEVSYCSDICPPGWSQTEVQGEQYCYEPAGVPSVAEGCPGMYVLFAESGTKWCGSTCPPGWASGYHGAVKECVEQPSAPPPQPRDEPSSSTPKGSEKIPPRTAGEPDTSEAAIGAGALPWWVFAAGGALLVGAAVYYRVEG
jgi:hypothetical protein